MMLGLLDGIGFIFYVDVINTYIEMDPLHVIVIPCESSIMFL
jgi:hypothetical protein